MTSSAPRIGVMFAIPELDKAGPDRVFFELLTSLDRERFAPSLLVSSERGYYLERLPADVPVVVTSSRYRLLHRFPVAQALRAVHRTKPDVVFATLRMTMTLGIAARALPRASKLVLRQANDLTADFSVLMERSLMKHRIARQVALASLRQADAVVCQSASMRDDLASVLGPRTPLHVIHNPVNIEAAREAACARDVALRGTPSLVSVGRLAAQKGFDLLLPALARVRDDHPDVHVTILGDGPDRARLEAQVADLGIRQHVTFTGFEAEPLPSVRNADLFVLCSRYEGFPNAVLEALAVGTPVVVTDCPGANAVIVKPGVNGEIADAVTVESFAAALRRAIEHRPHYDAAHIVTDCQERFGVHRIVREYEQLFEDVARRGASS